jgi:phage shock protein A
VAYRLRMSGEIRDWLAGLPGGDLPMAMRVGPALLALIREGHRLGPPLVISPARAAQPLDPVEQLDLASQDRLERLQAVRRHAAEAASLAAEIRAEIASLEPLTAEQDPGAPARLAELRRLLPGVADAERQLTEQNRRMQQRVNAFRARREVLTARYVAALAARSVREELTALGEDGDVAEAEAAGRVEEITAEIERELGHDAAADDLLELRPSADVRIIFAVEPPGAALLIAVLEGGAAVRGRRGEALMLSARVLGRVRAGQAPETTEYAVDDPRSFLAEFLPGRAEDAEAAAAALIAGNRARTVDDLAGHVEALGGRLQVIADFGDDRIQLA